MITTDRIVGLSQNQVQESRERYGQNVLTPTKRPSILMRFLAKFKDPIILILIVAGVLSLGIAIYEYVALNEPWNAFAEPIGILIAILLSTVISFIFELKADKEFSILNKADDEDRVIVIREGFHKYVPKKDIVVGDVVVLQIGDEVPADGTLIESLKLRIDESSLTGEPSCLKSALESDFSQDATYPSNEVLRGTKVMDGHGIFQVEKVGDSTECGKVFKSAQIDNGVKTPLNEQLEKLGMWISRISYLLAVLVVVGRIIGYLTVTHGLESFEWVHFLAFLLESVMIAVTLIVVAVPEGLPMAVTLSLAYSMRRMIQTKNLVRKMHACETMGAITVICTDKTGTLTQNTMSVADVWYLHTDNPQDELLLRQSIAINSTATLDSSCVNGSKMRSIVGNPTEGAMLLWLYNNGTDYQELRDSVSVIDEVPFSTDIKYMATLVKDKEANEILFIKGAPEIVFRMCSITDEQRNMIASQALLYQQRAMRMIAFAYLFVKDNSSVSIQNLLSVKGQLQFLCLVAISDPVRDDVPAAVKECLSAGIKVKVVTGDIAGTAVEIGKQIGIWTDKDGDENIITGSELELLQDEELMERSEKVKIIARARPADKERLVKALQANNEIVAVTGDGTNDAPALNAAHVGLSMGDGTSVAKEASDITIIDNSFASIGRAVMWGRSLYQNIQRFILFQMTVNVAACLIVLAGAFMGIQSPLTVTQMLWINLIMDTFAAMALASLPPNKEVMNDQPRDRNAFIVNGRMSCQICWLGGLFCAIMIGYCWLLEHVTITPGELWSSMRITDYNGLSNYESGLLFSVFVFLQFWNLFNAKAFLTNKSALKMKDCRSFIFIVLLILVGQLIIIYFGGEFFNVEPLALRDLISIIVSTSLVMWIGEVVRAVKRIRVANR